MPNSSPEFEIDWRRFLLASLSPLTESNVTSYAIGRKGRSALP